LQGYEIDVQFHHFFKSSETKNGKQLNLEVTPKLSNFHEEKENEFLKLCGLETEIAIIDKKHKFIPIHHSILHKINKLDIDTIHPKHSTSDPKKLHQIQSKPKLKSPKIPSKIHYSNPVIETFQNLSQSPN
jgi:hypothetical protein